MSDETHLPNVISILRIAGSIGLLFCDVAGWMFWALYALCGISDMVDGFLLFLTVPTMFWSMIPISIVAAIATFAAVQEGHFIRRRHFSATLRK